jgi:GNAT superfamily N-acetyltransferase
MARPLERELILDEYGPGDNQEALALERICLQGRAFRLSFRRSHFHRRAENFADHRIITARLGGRLVGIAAMAFKDVILGGRSLRAVFLFDLRVHPSYRNRGIARRLGREIELYSSPRSDLGYAYTVADNRAARGMCALFGAQDVGGYAYLVYPAFRALPAASRAGAATLEEVHREMLRVAGPFDFYADPLPEGRMQGHVASWLVRRRGQIAGCSAWNNREILSEVVERLPLRLRAASGLLDRWPFALPARPRLPRPGEELRSWYLFDMFASDPLLARDLMRQVSAAARERGIDYCYLPHLPGDGWVRAVRADIPRFFASTVPYRLQAFDWPRNPVPRVERIYLDVRDL